MTLGTKLKEQQNYKGISQTELAKKTKISQQSISAYEKDNKQPTIGICIKLADFYNISLDELVGRDFKGF